MPRLHYGATKFKPESLALINAANAILDEYAKQGFDLTLRQLYYQFVARGYLANNDRNYKRLGSVVNDARLSGLIDWDHIVDRTRNLKSQPHWANAGELVKKSADWFGIDRWADQPYYVEVWIEKDALIGVIDGVCRSWDVPFFSCRGYTSQSEMWGAAQRIGRRVEEGKSALILHLGDHDPSGIDMTRDIEDRLETFMAYDHYRATPRGLRAGLDDEAVDAGRGKGSWAWPWVQERFRVDRIALTMDQIREFDPPPNPAKLTDARARGYIERYGDESWELDALDPTTLAGLISAGVEGVLDAGLWEEATFREDAHRATLERAAERWDEVAALVNGDAS